MGSQTAFYPTTQVNSQAGRSSYHPYHSLDSFNNLRHRLPSAISANIPLTDGYVGTTWAADNQPTSYSGYTMPHLPHDYHFNHGQDASFQFPQGAFPYPNAYHDTHAVFNGEDFDIASMSGDDDIEGPDSNAQLRSQQLNSDGTPKRPMNAFMIFARKRRPMVSSEQPTMRTGEISKLLSREWSEMPKDEKQFYLDQAKKLKDAFNMRWPDYVYRRRPNNSRKRRKLVSASGVGPVRTNEGISDGQAGTPADSTGANHSGDESQSQSADSVSSPLSTQSKHLYPATDSRSRRSPGQISDRSPTPSVASAGYGMGSAYVPSAHSKNLGDQTLPGQAKIQTEIYAGGQSPYYGDLNPDSVFGHNGSSDVNHGWHPFSEQVPCGATGSLKPSPPPITASPPHTTRSAVAATISDPIYAPSTWTKSAASQDSQAFEGSTKLWGILPALGDYRAVNEQGMHSILPSEESALGISHLGFRSEAQSRSPIPIVHPFEGSEPRLVESSHYHSAYMDGDGLAQRSHAAQSSPSVSPYEGSIQVLHETSSPYIGSVGWAPDAHTG